MKTSLCSCQVLKIVINKIKNNKIYSLIYSIIYLKKVPLKRKFGETEKNPRYLEAEGLYVGQKPYMTNANKNLLADRLLKQPDQVC